MLSLAAFLKLIRSVFIRAVFLLAALLFYFEAPLAFASIGAQSDMASLQIRSIDLMKFTKDQMSNQFSEAQVENVVSVLAQAHVNYLAISIPMDPSSDYPDNTKPVPLDAYVLTQQWASAIHGRGIKIIWRGTWAGVEGIYGFKKLVGQDRFPVGTANSAAQDGNSTWLGKTYQYIVGNPDFFAAGDIWAPMPERTEGIFQDSTSFLPYSDAGIQVNYADFFIDLKKVSDQAFARIGKSVITGMTANNYTELQSTWLPQNLVDAAGVVAIDYYGKSHTASEMDQDLRQIHAFYRKPIFLQEWGDYWNSGMDQADRAAYLEDIYAVLQQLEAEKILVGFNYWGGWDNSAEGLLTKDSSGFHLNSRGLLLANFFGPESRAQTTQRKSLQNPKSKLSEPKSASQASTQTVSISPQHFWVEFTKRIRILLREIIGF